MLSPFVTENSFLFYRLVNLGSIIKYSTTYFLFGRGLLGYTMIGNKIYYKRREVERFIKRHINK